MYITDTELTEAYEESNILEEVGPKERIGVVRCILVQLKKSEDWHKTTIFHTFIGQKNKVCKVIIDNGSYINTISNDVVSKLDLTSVNHPNPYKVG